MEEMEKKPKKKSIWKRLEENKKLQVLVFVVSMVVVLGIFPPLNSHMRTVREKDILKDLQVSTDYDIWFGLDEVSKQEESLKLSGWMLRKNSKISRARLVLRAIDGSDTKVYFAENVRRKEAEEYYKADWEIGASGFSVDVPAKEIEKDVTYEVQLVLCYDTEIETEEGFEIEEVYNKIDTGWYLYNDELYRYDPVVFVEPQVEDEELQTVIEEGVLRAYDLEYQLWIYQYGQKIYHIWDPSHYSIKELQTGILVSAQTHQQELLPEHRIQHGFDYLGVYFADDTYERVGIRPYQVVVITLSEKYFTTYLVTGLYDGTNEKRLNRINIPMMK